MPGIRSPLADRKPGEIDFIVVRENNEGEYSSIGGRSFEGTEQEIVQQMRHVGEWDAKFIVPITAVLLIDPNRLPARACKSTPPIPTSCD